MSLPDDSPRALILREAERLIMGDRNNQYGPPTQDFDRTAAILNAMGYRAIGGRKLQPHDVALVVMAVKMSRLAWMPEKQDSWADMAGYVGCGWECVVEEGKRAAADPGKVIGWALRHVRKYRRWPRGHGR